MLTVWFSCGNAASPVARLAASMLIVAGLSTALPALAAEPAPAKPLSEPPLSAEATTPLPVTLTSFGGAVSGDAVYVYGGNLGSSHEYSNAGQNDTLYRLSLAGGDWEKVAVGPPLQGLALVAHEGRLIRLGGFTARNAEGESHDLWSRDDVAWIDPQAPSPTWHPLPSLPEPRSSFDAAVLGDHVYVVGGWAMAGRDGKRVWHETAWRMDLAAEQPDWTPIAAPSGPRRALAVAAHAGKIVAIGGMTEAGDTTLETEIYDPQTDRWTAGPELAGEEPIGGFGASAFATGGSLYVSGVTGQLQRLAADGARWVTVAETPTARFFHRMLPVDDQHLIIVGGANRDGRLREVEILALPR
jgi:hypothetical protein